MRLPIASSLARRSDTAPALPLEYLYHPRRLRLAGTRWHQCRASAAWSLAVWQRLSRTPQLQRTALSFVVGGLDIVDQVFQWAEEFGLRVVLDLHAAPGCQNGFDNGGIMGVCECILTRISLTIPWMCWSVWRSVMQSIRRCTALKCSTNLAGIFLPIAEALQQRCLSANSAPLSARAGDGGVPRCFRNFREYAGFLQEPQVPATWRLISIVTSASRGTTSIWIFSGISARAQWTCVMKPTKSSVSLAIRLLRRVELGA